MLKVHTNMVVSSTWLAAHSKDRTLVILHVARDRSAYEQGHVPGARLILLNRIVEQREGNDNELAPVERLKEVFESAGVSNSSRIVIYDDGPGMLAARAYFTLDYLGAAGNAALLDGGFAKWIAGANPVERQEPKVARGSLRTRVRPELVVQHARMRSIVERATRQSGGAPVLIDARAPQQFSAKPPAGGHIPGAQNVFWMSTLESSNNPVLKPAETVRAAYTQAGLKPGAKALVYCSTGMQASHAYFTLKWLGYDPVLYDGSFQDWARDPSAPVQ